MINGTANIYTGGNTELTNIVNGTTVGPGITSTYAVLGNPGGDQRDPDGVSPSGGYAFGAGGGGIGYVGQTTSGNSTTNGNGGAGLNAVTINGISYNFQSYFTNNAAFGYNGYIGGGGGGSDGSGTKVGINGLLEMLIIITNRQQTQVVAVMVLGDMVVQVSLSYEQDKNNQHPSQPVVVTPEPVAISFFLGSGPGSGNPRSLLKRI